MCIRDRLNRDPVEVDRYRADERCTFIFTLNAYYSMFSGSLRLYDPAQMCIRDRRVVFS